MERYYYKTKAGDGLLNLKEPIEDDKIYDYEEITEDEFNRLASISLYEPTQEERNKADIIAKIYEIKSKLATTDYQAIKYAEGCISEEDYAPIKAQRQSLRDQINALEKQLN